MKNAPHVQAAPPKDSKGGFSITVVHLGRKYYQMTLWASTYINQRKWVESITKQQEVMKQRSMIFGTTVICENFFVGVSRVNCAAPFREY
jgi:RHO1 GDP-GTP exchange protein 1/2